MVGGTGFEGGESIWLAGASGTIFACGGFGLKNELELEADFGGFVAFDVEDRWEDMEDEDERCCFSFRNVNKYSRDTGRETNRFKRSWCYWRQWNIIHRLNL